MTYHEWLASRYPPRTAYQYEREVDAYLKRRINTETASPLDILSYLGALRNQYSLTSIHRILASLKSYYYYLFDLRIITRNPAYNLSLVDKIRPQVQLQDLFTQQELASLIQGCRNLTLSGIRDRLIISFLIYQALHPKEIAGLFVTDINMENKTVNIKMSPKVNKRILGLKEIQVTYLNCYFKHIRPLWHSRVTNDNLFITSTGRSLNTSDLVKLILAKARKKISHHKASARTIRQSVLANLFKYDHDVSIIQAFAGHLKPETTLKYQERHINTLRVAVDRFHLFHAEEPANHK